MYTYCARTSVQNVHLSNKYISSNLWLRILLTLLDQIYFCFVELTFSVCAHVCVCAYVQVCVCMHVCTCVSVYVCARICMWNMHVCECINMLHPRVELWWEGHLLTLHKKAAIKPGITVARREMHFHFNSATHCWGQRTEFKHTQSRTHQKQLKTYGGENKSYQIKSKLSGKPSVSGPESP